MSDIVKENERGGKKMGEHTFKGTSKKQPIMAILSSCVSESMFCFHLMRVHE